MLVLPCTLWIEVCVAVGRLCVMPIPSPYQLCTAVGRLCVVPMYHLCIISVQLLVGYERNYLELWDAVTWKPLKIFGPFLVGLSPLGPYLVDVCVWGGGGMCMCVWGGGHVYVFVGRHVCEYMCECACLLCIA